MMFRGFSLKHCPNNDHDTDAPGLYSNVKYTDQLSTTDSDYQCKIDGLGCRFTTHVSTTVLHLVNRNILSGSDVEEEGLRDHILYSS